MSGLFAPPQTLIFSAIQYRMETDLPDWTLVAAVDSGVELPEQVVVLQTSASEDTDVNAAWGDDDYRMWTIRATMNLLSSTDNVDLVAMNMHTFMKGLRGSRFDFERGSILIRSVVATEFFVPVSQNALPQGKALTQQAGQYRLTMEVL